METCGQFHAQTTLESPISTEQEAGRNDLEKKKKLLSLPGIELCTVELVARPYTDWAIPSPTYSQKLWPLDHSRTIEKSIHLIGNRTRHPSACSIVPQSTTLTRAHFVCMQVIDTCLSNMLKQNTRMYVNLCWITLRKAGCAFTFAFLRQ
jgi:hypothetical protein